MPMISTRCRLNPYQSLGRSPLRLRNICSTAMLGRSCSRACRQKLLLRSVSKRLLMHATPIPPGAAPPLPRGEHCAFEGASVSEIVDRVLEETRSSVKSKTTFANINKIWSPVFKMLVNREGKKLLLGDTVWDFEGIMVVARYEERILKQTSIGRVEKFRALGSVSHKHSLKNAFKHWNTIYAERRQQETCTTHARNARWAEWKACQEDTKNKLIEKAPTKEMKEWIGTRLSVSTEAVRTASNR